LAAILFPVFAKAREKARQITCASNLKQIGLGLLQYVQDYDEQMPEDGTPIANGYVTWQTTIFPYIKNGGQQQGASTAATGNVFTCPSNANTEFTWASAPGMDEFSCDYACNRNNSFNVGGSGNGAFPTQYGSPINIASFNSPSQLIALVENNGTAGGNGGWNLDPTNSGHAGALFAGHTQNSNWLFCDGHVKALHPFGTLSTLDGGTASSNYWVRNGVAFSDSSDPNSASDLANSKTFMQDAVNQYK
jgi:prepilin-type processing-associated H-X9-DG protein